MALGAPAAGATVAPRTSFNATGQLEGFGDAAHSGPPLFSLNLSGLGVLSFDAFHGVNTGGAPFWSIVGANATAQFSATPEPATLLLFGTGIIAVARGLRRARHLPRHG
jgi:PEP-CTERM motif-containing protein